MYQQPWNYQNGYYDQGYYRQQPQQGQQGQQVLSHISQHRTTRHQVLPNKPRRELRRQRAEHHFLLNSRLSRISFA